MIFEVIELIDFCSRGILTERERYWISQEDSDNCYNKYYNNIEKPKEEFNNKLHELIVTDHRTVQEISKKTGVHSNTIDRLIRSEFGPVDRRVFQSISRLARLYGYDVKVRLDFVPIGNGDDA